MTRDKTEKRIAELKEKIKSRELTDSIRFDEELKELRNYVLYVHMKLESGLEFLLVHYFLSFMGHKLTVVDKFSAAVKMTPFFDEINFLKKAKNVFQAELISNALKNKLMKINEVRNWFAHPKTYTNELRKFENREKYLKVLEMLEQALREIEEKIDEEIVSSKKKSKISPDA